MHKRNDIILIFTFSNNFLPATTIRLHGEKLYFYDSLEGRNLRKKESNKQAVRRNNMRGKVLASVNDNVKDISVGS